MQFRYRNEEEMKDSGIEWINSMPISWKKLNLRWYLSCKSGDFISSNTDEEIDKNIPIIGGNGIMGYCNKHNTKDTVLAVGRVGALCGNVHLINYPCWITDNSLIIHSISKEIFIGYLYRILTILNLNSFSTSTAQPLITSETIKKRNVCVPNLVEQVKIANFLDEKTAQFDTIILKKEALIKRLEEAKKSLISEVVTGKVKVVKTSNGYELVERKKEELKDSGVEWLGNIPIEWETKAIKYLFQLRNERNTKDMKEVQLLSLFTALGVKKQGEVIARGNKVRTVEDYKEVYPDDIVVNIILAWMGAVGVSHDRGVISPAYDIYKPINLMIHSKFYHYVFRTGKFSGECYKKGRGIMDMRWRTYSDEFKSIIVPVISIDEQKLLSCFLDGKIMDIESLIKKTIQQINKIKEAKQSLISEAVTGKIEILD